MGRDLHVEISSDYSNKELDDYDFNVKKMLGRGNCHICDEGTYTINQIEDEIFELSIQIARLSEDSSHMRSELCEARALLCCIASYMNGSDDTVKIRYG